MEKLLLITPPFLQPNCPYPATAYLKGYLTRKGYEVEQADLSIRTLNRIFSREGLRKIFEEYTPVKYGNLQRIYALRQRYLDTVDNVLRFLQSEEMTIATLICTGDYLPQAGRFEQAQDLEYHFGSLGTVDCAKYLATLYLQDISDFIRAFVSEHFEIVRYAEKIAVSVPTFKAIETELEKPVNRIETLMLEELEQTIVAATPTHIGFSVPFPGNLLATLRGCQYIRENHPEIRIIIGGGYPSTELRSLTDPAIFRYVDYIVLDDGELPLERILSNGELIRTYTPNSYQEGGAEPIQHADRGCPDFTGLDHSLYFSTCEVTNPMHRLWGDGRWNKMMITHGCYWAKCAFCDTSLDYICRYETVPAATFVDWMETVIKQTGSHGFHFVDEAASPKLLKEISLEILRRKLNVSWWTNIRFESQFTGDLTQLMAAAGCIGVSGGLETASERLLEHMKKGVTLEQAILAMRNFYYAGIMVHSYLMYAFPSQTLQESVDALEVVRQLFRAELITSAFWHRFALTVHSPVGVDPEAFGIKCHYPSQPFANNELPFRENRDYKPEMVGQALNDALMNYLVGNHIKRPVEKWFAGKNIPKPTVENSFITDQLIKPDASRIFSENARLVFLGVPPTEHPDGLTFYNNAATKNINFKPEETAFLKEITAAAADLRRKVTFAEVKTIYAKYSEEPFLVFYHGKKWDFLRKYGLLQL